MHWAFSVRELAPTGVATQGTEMGVSELGLRALSHLKGSGALIASGRQLGLLAVACAPTREWNYFSKNAGGAAERNRAHLLP